MRYKRQSEVVPRALLLSFLYEFIDERVSDCFPEPESILDQLVDSQHVGDTTLPQPMKFSMPYLFQHICTKYLDLPEPDTISLGHYDPARNLFIITARYNYWDDEETDDETHEEPNEPNEFEKWCGELQNAVLAGLKKLAETPLHLSQLRQEIKIVHPYNAPEIDVVMEFIVHKSGLTKVNLDGKSELTDKGRSLLEELEEV